MSDELPGQATSVWLDTTPETDYPKLSKSGAKYDAAIVGGGIAGLLTAWFLQAAGLKIAIVEKEHIVENTTGNTTAKLTSQHYMVYNDLVDKHGRQTAQTYADANQQAIDDIEKLAKELNIDCDFSRRDAYVYTHQDKKVAEIEKEVETTKSLGLPASFEETSDLPFPIKAAIKFSHQAQFHPRKFLLAIASELAKNGADIYEETEAEGIEPGTPNVLKTKKGNIKADYIIEASKYPFWQPDMFKDAMWRKLSYALGLRIEGKYPQGMYITTDDPLRSIRSHPYKDGELLIFGGDSHELTPDYDKNQHWQNLLDDAPKKFKVKEVIYRWIAGDNMPYDLLPYIGPYPKHPNIYIATGFRAWGLTWAMVAAHIISDDIAGKPHPWAETFSLNRLHS